MKLYNLDHSPYATRVRIQIYKKGLDIEIQPPPEALRSEAFIARFPMGKIPVLELEDGGHLPDSWVIMDYLEEVTPAISLRPEGATASAHMQLMARYADTYLGPSGLSPLFQRISGGEGTEGAEDQVIALDTELARLERLLAFLPAFEQRELHLGDIALVPHMEYVQLLAPMFGFSKPLANYPRANAWREWVLGDAAVERGKAEMVTAVEAFFSR